MKEFYEYLIAHPYIGGSIAVLAGIGIFILCYFLIKRKVAISEINLGFIKFTPKADINNNLTPTNHKAETERKEIFEGKWIGKGRDIVVQEENLKSIFSYVAEFSLIKKGVTIYTDGFIDVYKENILQFRLDFKANGTIYDGKCNLSYLVENKDVSGYGVWNLHLNRDGTAVGYFISSRIDNQGFGFGKMEFKKQLS